MPITQRREKRVGVFCLSYNQQHFKMIPICFASGGGILWDFSRWIMGRRGCKNRFKSRQAWAGCCSFLCLFFSDRQGGLSQVSEWQTKWLESSQSACMRTYTVLRAYGSEGFWCNNITCLIPRDANPALVSFLFLRSTLAKSNLRERGLVFAHSPWLQRIIMEKSRQLVTTHSWRRAKRDECMNT